MGRIIVQIEAQNYSDVHRMKSGEIAPKQVRTIHAEALVDTGATMLCLPESKVAELGLAPIEKRRVITANGEIGRNIYGGAFLTIKGRSCTIDVAEVPENVPPVVGYLALEALDFVGDPTKQQVISNPAHNGKFMHDLLWLSV